MPPPISTIGPKTPDQYPVSGDTRDSQAIPMITGIMPISMSRCPPKRGISRGASRDTPNSRSVIGRNATPASSGRKPSTSWRNWVRKKNMPNMPRHQQQPREERPGAARVGEQPQRRDRLRRAGLVEYEGREQHGGRRERGDGHAVAPAVGRGPDEGVDQRGDARRGGDGARQVEAAGLARRLGHEQRGEHRHHDADRHVDEQHPAPGHPLGDHAAEDEAERAAAHHHARVDGQGPESLLAFGEAADDER